MLAHLNGRGGGGGGYNQSCVFFCGIWLFHCFMLIGKAAVYFSSDRKTVVRLHNYDSCVGLLCVCSSSHEICAGLLVLFRLC